MCVFVGVGQSFSKTKTFVSYWADVLFDWKSLGRGLFLSRTEGSGSPVILARPYLAAGDGCLCLALSEGLGSSTHPKNDLSSRPFLHGFHWIRPVSHTNNHVFGFVLSHELLSRALHSLPPWKITFPSPHEELLKPYGAQGSPGQVAPSWNWGLCDAEMSHHSPASREGGRAAAPPASWADRISPNLPPPACFH